MITRFHVNNLNCADCALGIEKHLKSVRGFEYADLNFASLTLTVETDNPELIRKEVQKIEPGVELIPLNSSTQQVPPEKSGFQVKRNVLIIAISSILFIVLLTMNSVLGENDYGTFYLYALALSSYLLAGWNVIRGAARTIRRGVFFDENVLMTIATFGAIGIKALSEAVGVMIFYKIGEFFQNLAVHRSRNSIRSLLAVRPNLAHVIRDDKQVDLSPEEASVGESIVIRPGEKVPLDCLVQSGSSRIDTSALTGEPTPRRASPGDTILAGEVNLSSLIRAEVTRPFSSSTIVKLLEQVESASSRKAKTEKFISRVARIYTPIVVSAAALIGLLPPLIYPGQDFSTWIYRALVLLVISCPCALVISIPLGFFGGIGGASRRGILIKGAHFLERLSGVKTVVFDKTGTLTKGVFTVHRIISQSDYTQREILEFAGAAEFHSNHPIACSIKEELNEYNISIDPSLISYHKEIPGKGIEANYKTKRVLVGNGKLMEQNGINVEDKQRSSLHIAINDTLAGYLVVGDELKEESITAIQKLRKAGVRQIWMLTGDHYEPASETASVLGIDNFRASLLPEDKVTCLEEILRTSHDGSIAFVGDGINDAPVLARADVGIAMGTLGSDAAIETADVVINGDSPVKVAEAIKIARTTNKIVWQNIFLALGVKIVFVSFGALGLASIWEAIFADVGMAIAAIINSGRALKQRSVKEIQHVQPAARLKSLEKTAV
ncbi:Lead, cadmium, zinc and mercury transporting P-type ATPase [Chitinispirillum alkaliphilum]|nr:Lead, cadmium, zinc and mercury transporting P-type ATPase [Chitinispirillum alkaliphilum]